jgi:hypothetical protein
MTITTATATSATHPRSRPAGRPVKWS